MRLRPPGVESGPPVVRNTDKAARGLWPTSVRRNGGSCYSEEPGMEILQHGEAHLRIATVPDGYVDHLEMRPGPALFRHFVEHVRDLAGSVYGRRTYEIMRYWDEDLPEWDAEELDFAAAWRSQPKWVVSRSLKSVGPNATLVQNDVGTVLRELKARLVGEIDVAGPDLARSLTDLGLVDEYRLYFRPFVLGHGTPFFAGPPPPLRLVASDPIGEDTIRLTYVPA